MHILVSKSESEAGIIKYVDGDVGKVKLLEIVAF